MKYIYIIISIFWATVSFSQSNYQYDNEGRIIYSDDGVKEQSYHYDNLGNRTSYVLTSTLTNTKDLSVGNITANVSMEQGQTYNVSCTVYNNDTENSISSVLKVYVSTTSTGTEVEVGSFSVSSINGNGSVTANLSINIPNDLDLGNQFLVFFIDAIETIAEIDETNNKDSQAITVVAPNLAELGLQNASLNVATVEAGGVIDLSAIVGNTGNLIANNFTVTSYLSLNDTYDANDILLNATQNIGSLDVSNTTNYMQITNISANTVAGNYYIIFYVDLANSVAEIEEGNNYVAVPIEVTSPEETIPPTASFTADNQVVEISNTVHFTDTSSNEPTSWLWYFPGGTPSSSTLQNPTVIYNSSGVYDVTLIASNTNGDNNDNENNYITVEVDSTNPVANCQNITVQLDENGNVTIDPALVNNGSSDNIGIVSYALEQETFTCSALGVNTVNFTVYDAAGNSDTCSTSITIEDSVLPILSMSNLPNINAQCEVTSLTPPTATDNCSGIITGTTNVTLPITSNTTITWNYDDGNGNSVSQIQEVVINDTTNPVAVSQEITIDLNGVSSISIVASQIDNGSTDNCIISDISIDVSTFTAIGDYTVVLRDEDANNNVSFSSTIVHVIDTTAAVTDNQFSNSIIIYPNPTKGLIKIDIENIQIKSVKIYSLLGKLVKKVSNKTEIDLTSFAAGTYLVEVTSVENKKAIKKIIKQ